METPHVRRRATALLAAALFHAALLGPLASLFASPLPAQDATEQVPETDQAPGDDERITWSQFVGQLDLWTDQITVQGGKATIDVPEGWHYVHQTDARRIVEDVWGNPPDPTTLGLLMPPGFESDEEGTPTWAIIVSYDDEGHTEDDDAADTDFDELLELMQEDTREASAERTARGYESIELLGWAERPHYDSDAKKLYWAKHLSFGGEPGTLNYDIRILGRRGTLVLQAVASMDELAEVRAATEKLLPATHFVEGERYEDYQEGIDPVVAGGIGALIGGKLLAKGGLLKVLLKPLLVVFALVGGFFARLMGRKKANEREQRRAARNRRRPGGNEDGDEELGGAGA